MDGETGPLECLPETWNDKEGKLYERGIEVGMAKMLDPVGSGPTSLSTPSPTGIDDVSVSDPQDGTSSADRLRTEKCCSSVAMHDLQSGIFPQDDKITGGDFSTERGKILVGKSGNFNRNDSPDDPCSPRNPIDKYGEYLDEAQCNKMVKHFDILLSKRYLIDDKGVRLPPEKYRRVDKFAAAIVKQIVEEAVTFSSSLGWSIKCSGQCHREQCREDYQRKEASWNGSNGKFGSCKSSLPLLGLSCGSPGLCWTPELPYSPSHRPLSRASLGSSLSFSHDSLVSGVPRLDDSHLITGAVSHDALLFPNSKTSRCEADDNRGLPSDADVYAEPVDVVKLHQGRVLHPKAIMHQPKKKHRRHPKVSNTASGSSVSDSKRTVAPEHSRRGRYSNRFRHYGGPHGLSSGTDLLRASKRHSVPSNMGCELNTTPKHSSNSNKDNNNETALNDVRKSFHESDDALDSNRTEHKCPNEHSRLCRIIPFTSMKSCKRKDAHEQSPKDDGRKKGRSISSNIRNTLITIFGFRKNNVRSGESNDRYKSVICVNGVATRGFGDRPVAEDDDKSGPLVICKAPPSGPPLNHSTDYSAFTDRVSASNSVRTQQPILINNNNNNNNNTSNNNNQKNGSHKQSNGVHHAGLLSCLGHSRSDAGDSQDASGNGRQATSGSSSSANKSSANRALPPLPGSELPGMKNCETGQDGAKCNYGDKKEEEGCDFASIIEKVKDVSIYLFYFLKKKFS